MFCKYCGTQIADDAAFCSHCGQNTAERRVSYVAPTYDSQLSGQALVTKFVERLKTNAIIWIVIGSIQILIGLAAHWAVLVIGIVNLIDAISDIRYANQALRDPRGIVDHVRPLVSPIIALIFNLLIGAVIGIVGVIYYLIAVRGFALENEVQFREIERSLNQSFS